jgi:hypothetical protein
MDSAYIVGDFFTNASGHPAPLYIEVALVRP